jgi:predicted DsbA family dithiol-disulfide isomerase
MDATFYFDPTCPFTWRTARWLTGVAAERDVSVSWRAFSLALLNGDGAAADFRERLAASTRALRLVEALAADGRHDDVAAFYTEMGNRTFEAGTTLTDDIVLAAAEAAGVEDPQRILDDESWDESVRASHDRAFRTAGPDVGSPVLAIDGAPRGVHGPILDLNSTPGREEALAIWDAVVPLARSGVFVELKRGRG